MLLKFKLYKNLEDWQECKSVKRPIANKGEVNFVSQPNYFASTKPYSNKGVLDLEFKKELREFIGSVAGLVPLNVLLVNPASDPKSKGSFDKETGVAKIWNDHLTNRQAALLVLHETFEKANGSNAKAHAEAIYFELQHAGEAGVSNNFIRSRLLTFVNTYTGNGANTSSGFANPETKKVMNKILQYIKDHHAELECIEACSNPEQDKMRGIYGPKKKVVK